MTLNTKNKPLFNASGCLSREGLLDYIHSQLGKKEHTQVEAHLKTCELCRDAAEGLKLSGNRINTERILQYIDKDIKENVTSERKKIFTGRSKTFYYSAAAIIIILIGVTFLLHYRTQNNSGRYQQEELILSESAPVSKRADKSQHKGEEVDHQDNLEDKTSSKKAQPGSKNTTTYEAPVDEIEQSVRSSEPIKKEMETTQASEKGKEEITIDIASNQPYEYYLAEVVITNLKATIDNTFENINPLSFKAGEIQQSRSNQADSSSSVHFTSFVEQMPEFPGGYEGLSGYLAENLVYPEEAKKNDISGRVVVSFIINRDGRIKDPQILYGISQECDMEALRVISQMPEWEPALQNGRPVNVQFILPIYFKIL